MPLPTVVFNTATGSDTAASGYGPPTAVSGTAAATTAASAVVSVLTDNPDLSTISAGDLLWVDSSSGRQFSIVVSVNNTAGVKTITATDNFANTEGTRNWGVGGKRATFNNANSRKLFTADYKAGWTIETEDTQTITASAITLFTAGDVTTGYVTIRGKSGAVREITTTFNGALFSCAGAAWIRLQNVKLSCSAATKTSSIGLNCGANNIRYQLVDVTIGDATNTFNRGIVSSGAPVFIGKNIEITSTLSHGIDFSAGGTVALQGSWIHDAAGSGKGINATAAMNIVLDDCAVTGNASDGILLSAGSIANYVDLDRCVIHNNGGDGIDVATALSAAANLQVNSCNITKNGGYGINAVSGADALKLLVDYNNFGSVGSSTNNTSGAMNNITSGAHDLAVDPGYVNAAGNNYAGGTNIKAKGYPDATINIGNNLSATLDYVDIGIQRQEAGGSGGVMNNPGMVGGIQRS